MFASLARAIGNFFDGTLRGVALKSVGITLVLFALLFAAFEIAIFHLPELGAPWINRALELLAPVIFVFFLFVFGPPMAAIFGSLYLDRVAGTIERRAYPGVAEIRKGRAVASLGAGARFTGLAVLLNLALLALDAELLPPLPEIVGILANGWLLGREYFELVALRHMSRGLAARLRQRNGAAIFAAGTIISLLSSVPVLDLIAPLFGVAMMVHLFMRSNAKDTQ